MNPLRTIILGLSTLLACTLVSQTSGLYVANSGFVTIPQGNTVYVAGDLGVANNIFNGGVLAVTGNISSTSNQPDFLGSTGELRVVGAQNQTYSSTKPSTLNHLTINKSTGNLLLQRSIQVDSSVFLQAGKLDLDTCALTLTDFKGTIKNETLQNHIYSDKDGYVSATYIPQNNKDVSGVGFVVDAPMHSFGVTSIQRQYQSHTNAGQGSIARTFRFIPTNKAEITNSIKTVTFAYNDRELSANAANEASLQLYYTGNTANTWQLKGGVVDIVNDSLSSSAISTLSADTNFFTAAIRPVQSTCTSNSPDHIAIRYLVASEALQGDTVYYIDLSTTGGRSINERLWTFGDGGTDSFEDTKHVYSKQGNFVNALRVSNGMCSNYATKDIKIVANPLRKDLDVAGALFAVEAVCFPNPTVDELLFVTKLNYTVSSQLVLVDLLGREIFRKQYNSESVKEILNLRALAAGVYCLKFELLGQVHNFKVIKKDN